MSETPTYYDRPVLQEPVWIWTVPAYMYLGGVAAGCAVLAAACSRRTDLRSLVRTARRVSALAQSAGVPLLIADLGRPARFLNMLRVFRPTSPLSVGSWVLAASVPSSAAAAVLTGGAGELAGAASAALALPLAAYPGVLVAGTAIPAWQEARRTLPVAFVASAVAGAASALELLARDEPAARVVRRYGIVGGLAELAALAGVLAESSRVPRVGSAYRTGVAGASLAASAACTAASVLAALWRRGGLAGLLGSLGALLLRVGVLRAGWTSARDPRATFQSQRPS